MHRSIPKSANKKKYSSPKFNANASNRRNDFKRKSWPPGKPDHHRNGGPFKPNYGENRNGQEFYQGEVWDRNSDVPFRPNQEGHWNNGPDIPADQFGRPNATGPGPSFACDVSTVWTTNSSGPVTILNYVGHVNFNVGDVNGSQNFACFNGNQFGNQNAPPMPYQDDIDRWNELPFTEQQDFRQPNFQPFSGDMDLVRFQQNEPGYRNGSSIHSSDEFGFGHTMNGQNFRSESWGGNSGPPVFRRDGGGGEWENGQTRFGFNEWGKQNGPRPFNQDQLQSSNGPNQFIRDEWDRNNRPPQFNSDGWGGDNEPHQRNFSHDGWDKNNGPDYQQNDTFIPPPPGQFRRRSEPQFVPPGEFRRRTGPPFIPDGFRGPNDYTSASASPDNNRVLRNKPITDESHNNFVANVAACAPTQLPIPVVPGFRRRVKAKPRPAIETSNSSSSNADKTATKRKHEDATNSNDLKTEDGTSPELKKPKLQSSVFNSCPELWLGDDQASSGPPLKLFHYTDEAGAMGIIRDRFVHANPDDQPKLGTGIYFTEIPPVATTEDILYNNYHTLDPNSKKIARTEYCFEFYTKDIPNVEFCHEPSRYEYVKGRESRNVWVASLHKFFLVGTTGTYYVRELDGMGEPKTIQTRTWDL